MTVRTPASRRRTGTAAPAVPEVASRVRLAVMRLARRLRQESAEGLTPSMLSFLSAIHGAQPVTLGELAAIERVRPPTITAAVGRLEEQGLVHRRTDSRDRRVARVEITSHGRRLLAESRSRKTAYLEQQFAALSAEERATLARAAAILERLLEKEPS